MIGGTSLAGGVGTVAGAMLGAVLMQSLQSGMVLLGVDTPLQNIVVGVVLVLAVWLDTSTGGGGRAMSMMSRRSACRDARHFARLRRHSRRRSGVDRSSCRRSRGAGRP